MSNQPMLSEEYNAQRLPESETATARSQADSQERLRVETITVEGGDVITEEQYALERRKDVLVVRDDESPSGKTQVALSPDSPRLDVVLEDGWHRIVRE